MRNRIVLLHLNTSKKVFLLEARKEYIFETTQRKDRKSACAVRMEPWQIPQNNPRRIRRILTNGRSKPA